MQRLTKLILLIFLLCLQSLSAQQTFYQEQYRPQFHFTPPAKWMNDPNGLVYFNGTYHLFYQHYPDDIVWGPMHWVHASSTDLFHWKNHPIALYPDSLGNIFSGSAVIDKNNSAGFGNDAMIAIFTYHNDSLWVKGFRNTESQGIAYSLDEGLTWTKYENNPVLNNSGEKDFRDPKVFWNDEINKWNMVLAVGDRIKIFSSQNLKNWNYESDFKPEEDLSPLGIWECPDLFKMKVGNEEKWIMIVNHNDYGPNGGSCTRYFVGSFDGMIFKHEQPSKWLDHGTDFYAAVTYSNVPKNKIILIGWMSNWQYADKVPTNVWRSAMTLARELNLDKQDDVYFIRQNIVEQFSSVTVDPFSFDLNTLPFSKSDLDLSQAMINFECSTQDLKLKISNSLDEFILIQLSDNNFSIDRSKSGKINFSDNFAKEVQTMPVNESINGSGSPSKLVLKLFIKM